MYNECKGCMAYCNREGNNEFCGLSIIPYTSETQQCPCKTCLIKVVCVDTCDDFRHYAAVSKKDLEKRVRDER